MVTITLILLLLMFPVSLILLIKNPFNAASVVAVLTWLFGVMPGIYFVETGVIPSYSWRNMTYVGGPLLNGIGIESALLDLAILSAAFSLGCLLAEMLRSEPAAKLTTLRPINQYVTIFLFGVWMVSLIYFIALANWRIDLVLLPIREKVDESGYMKTIFMTVPLVLFVQAYWNSGKLDRSTIIWGALALYVAFSRPQRRDLVGVVMFLIAFLPLLRVYGDQIYDTASIAAKKMKNRVIAVFAMLFSLSLVPILWYSRNYFTAAADGRYIDPTQIRSFSEVLLGSPATGYPTFLLIERHVDSYGFDPLHTLTYLGTIFVPRSLWGGKPTDIDNVLENQYRLIENPSVFWFGELYYGFGLFAIPLAAMLGFGLYMLADRSAASPSLLARTLAAVIFMHSVTLFKNGISHFVINSAVFVLLLILVWATGKQPNISELDKMHAA